jgi:hypothetical protein
MKRLRRSPWQQAASNHRGRSDSYTQNHGKSGVVYVLTNSLLKEGLVKIGQSTRSGSARAADLNKEAVTGMPAGYICLFEQPTSDCGRAELEVHERLKSYRRGKWGQEFFEVDIETAKSIIVEVCEKFNFQQQSTHTSSPIRAPESRKSDAPRSVETSPTSAASSMVQNARVENRLIPSWLKSPPLGWPILFLLLWGVLKLAQLLSHSGQS